MDTADFDRVSPKECGMLAREVSGIISKIVENVMAETIAAASGKCDLQGQLIFSKNDVESLTQKQKTEGTEDTYLEIAIKTVIPAVLTAIGVTLHAHPALVILMAGSGGAIGTQLRKKNQNDRLDIPEADLSQIQADVVWDDEQLKAAKKTAEKKIEELKQSLDVFEKKYSDVSDVGTDRGFGEWVQQFWLYCEKHPEDMQLQMLRGLLLSRLACMGIQIYDSPELNDAGEPDVPFRDYLIDKHQGDTYTEVSVPVVYSKKALLARGEIK